MKKNCVLISSLLIAIGMASCPYLMDTRANAAADAFEDKPISNVQKTANSNELETADITVKEDKSSTSAVDQNTKDIEKWLSDDKKVEDKEEKKDEEKKDDEKKDDLKFPVDGVVQGDALRLREWPWGPVMGKYYTGDKLTVTGVSGEFYEVTIDGVKGYMHKNYVSIPDSAASRVVPNYPGDTRSGGYLSKEEGTKTSEAAGSYSSSNNGANNVSYKGSTDTGDLASYPGGKLPPDKFIALFGPVAQKSMKETGVPASVTLAQAILETGWGGSTIGSAKNLFGIKGTGPAGTTVVSTQECYDGTYVTIKDGFRMYNNWQESIDDHAHLVSNGRYKSAWDAYQANHDADAFARGIHQAGYATSPTYADNLISLMKQYNLYEWDK